MISVHNEAAQRLLEAMRSPTSGGTHRFLFGPIGAGLHQRSIQASLSYSRQELIRAAHFVRQNGAPYLRYLDIGGVESLLQNFVQENYAIVANDCWPNKFHGSYAKQVSEQAIRAFTEAIGKSSLFNPSISTTVYPLVPLQIQNDFHGSNFFLAARENLALHLEGDRLDQRVDASTFPPVRNSGMKTKTPNAWLGIRAPSEEVARKMKAAILGSAALTMEPYLRHTFTGRDVFGGKCTITDSNVSFSFGPPHTPALGDDIAIVETDQMWLAEIDRLLACSSKSARRKLFSLEYFYRAWPLDSATRFPIFCMALDGVFGDANQATAAVVSGIQNMLGDHVNVSRLRDLMSLRASVIHGGAPDVYDSSKYAKYYINYEADPIFDLEIIVSECMRKHIFSDSMTKYKNPHAHLIAKLSGKMDLSDPYEHTIIRPS